MGNTWFSDDELRKLQELIEASGPRADRLCAFLLSVTRVLVEQQFLVAESSWRGRETADRRDHLSELFPNFPIESLDGLQLLGEPITALLRRVNLEYHSDQRTKGAAESHSIVAAEQGGDFCIVCGRRDKTVVDHIDPVGRGGSRTDLSNLQILCDSCNSAKRNLAEEQIRQLLTPDLGAKVSASMRHKHLLDTGVDINNRRMGTCVCGTTAAESELVVEPFPNHAASTALTLRAYCSSCRRK